MTNYIFLFEAFLLTDVLFLSLYSQDSFCWALQPGFFLAKRRPGASPLLTAPHPTPQAGRPVTQAVGHFSRLSCFIYGVAEGTAWRFSLRLVQLDGFLGALLMGPFIHGTSMPRGAPKHMPGPQAGL